MARALTLYPDSGTPIGLNDALAGYRVGRAVRGLGVPPAVHVTTETPLLNGESIDDTYETGRKIFLPMLVFGPDNATYRARMLALVRATNPRHPCHLEVAQGDGQRRRIAVRYAGGLEGWEDKDTGGDTTWYRFVLELYAPEAHWFDHEPITLRFEYSDPPTWFPILPLVLGAGSVLGDATLTNPGEVDAWPTWTITGPGTAVSLDNTSTGESLDLVGDLGAGTLVIVTQPGQQSITLDGVDWWDKLTGTPSLWQVPPGSTAVSLALTGAAVGSSVQCSFFPLYRSAAW